MVPTKINGQNSTGRYESQDQFKENQPASIIIFGVPDKWSRGDIMEYLEGTGQITEVNVASKNETHGKLVFIWFQRGSEAKTAMNMINDNFLEKNAKLNLSAK